MSQLIALTAAEIEQQLDESLEVVLSSRRTAAEIARQLSRFEPVQQDLALDWIRIVAASNAELAYRFAGGISPVLAARHVERATRRGVREIFRSRPRQEGFTSLTHKRCEVLRIKRFDERYNDEVRARISGITPQDYTRMERRSAI